MTNIGIIKYSTLNQVIVIMSSLTKECMSFQKNIPLGNKQVKV